MNPIEEYSPGSYPNSDQISENEHITMPDLAESFAFMTDQLAEQDQQIVQKASELTAVLNSIHDGVILLNLDDNLVAENPTAKEMLLELYEHPNQQDLRHQLPEAFYLNAQNQLEINLTLKYATENEPQKFRLGSRVVSASASPTRTPDGQELGTIVVLRDITREAEAEQLKDGFIVSVSHELRTPLTIIKGCGDLLIAANQENMSETQLSFVNMINDKTKELMQHINKLISISEIQAGTFSITKNPVNFTDLAVRMSTKWGSLAKSKGLTFHSNIPLDEIWVNGDEERLEWALDNLLKNAHDYTLTGSIELKLEHDEQNLRVSVADTGVGLEDEHKQFLFTRFFRAENEKTFNVSGVGLGLFITRSLVELHSGLVWADSTLGAGSSFGFSLPILGLEHIN